MKSITEELVWFNGKVMPLTDARIGLEERGLNFADGVYEVVRIYNGRPFTLREHLERLARSADGIGLSLQIGLAELAEQIRSLIAQSGLQHGMVYLQLTRGHAKRLHAYPKNPRHNLYFYCRALEPLPKPGKAAGYKLISINDERWHRCWVKSIALLGNVLAKNQALAAGCDEAVMIHDGRVTECSTANIFCIKAGTLFTCPVGPKVLPGITRMVVMKLAIKLGIPVVETALPLAEAMKSDEVFVTSSTHELEWVRSWDKKPIASKCGLITLKLHQAYAKEVQRETAQPKRPPVVKGRTAALADRG